ncbi:MULTISPECIES: outer membrane channel protein TolC [Oceanimonas]|uniref:Outer membrane channel protein TolC n=1 Tax=Oceanimonas doudoroffii TaxID=84158 RepID=A0A233RJR3_9GAMM|nr:MULTISPECIES: outer membrane channel protein TolC [Oceanimonas]NHH99776.1 Outer membrane protein TolC [Oceanimonas sp. MB9]OXY83628.1 outer membrane channel protein TolC [Oceanimonas doudoroffii]
MKKTLLSTLVLLCTAGQAQAENLLEIYQQATQNDPQVREAKARRDAAFEKINESRAPLLPQVDLSAGANYTQSNQTDSTVTNAGVNLSQALYRRSSWVSLDITEKQAAQSEVSYKQEQQALIVRATQAYFNVLNAEDALSFVQANKEAVSRQLEQTKQRFEVGLSAMTDVHEAQAQFDQALADEILARNALDNSKEALRELTGMHYDQLAPLNTDSFSPQAPVIRADGWLEIALEQNLELHGQRIAKDIANEQIDLARAGHHPTLDLNAGLNSRRTDFSGTSTDSNNARDNTLSEGTLGVSFNLPLYSGGATSSQVSQAQYNYVAASEVLEKSFRSVQSSVYSSYNDVTAALGSIRAFEQLVISAESALSATEAGYEVGTRTIVDVLNATQQLYDARQQLSSARYNYIVSQLQLKQAAGNLTEQDLIDINNGLQR